MGQILARTLVLDQVGAIRAGLQDLAGGLGAPALGASWNPAPPPGPAGAPPTGASGGPPLLAELTSRELEVLRHMAAGDTNARTARRLVISEGTVKTGRRSGAAGGPR